MTREVDFSKSALYNHGTIRALKVRFQRRLATRSLWLLRPCANLATQFIAPEEFPLPHCTPSLADVLRRTALIWASGREREAWGGGGREAAATARKAMLIDVRSILSFLGIVDGVLARSRVELAQAPAEYRSDFRA